MKRNILYLCLAIGGILALALVLLARVDRRPVVVCFGDSLTSTGGRGGRYSDWLAKKMPQVRVVNAGIGGDTLEDGRRRFERDVVVHKPDVVLIALGANDFWQRSRSVSEMQEDLEYMVHKLRNSGVEVVVASCFGERDFWSESCVEFAPERYELAAGIARMEQSVCSAHNCLYLPNMQVDVKPNRLPPYWDSTDHLSSAGNEQVALRMMPYISEALARSGS